MTLSFGDRKLQLIQAIMKLNSEQSLVKIEQELKSTIKNEKTNDKILSLVKPIQKTLSLEKMIAEQNYKPIKKKDFYNKVARLKIDEPLEDLLAMLSK